MRLTLKANPLRREHLQDSLDCYNADSRHERREADRFRSFAHDESTQGDEASPDILWLKDDSSENAGPAGARSPSARVRGGSRSGPRAAHGHLRAAV